jgi:hypothetical protein
MSDTESDGGLLPAGCDPDDFGDVSKTKEERHARYFDENDDKKEQELPKLRVLTNCWFLDEKAFTLENHNIGSEDSVESARIDWSYYQLKSQKKASGELADRIKSSHTTKERKKKGKTTLNVVDYGVRDANARIAFNSGKFEDAVGYLEDMISRKDDEPNVWTLLGRCHVELKQIQGMSAFVLSKG